MFDVSTPRFCEIPMRNDENLTPFGNAIVTRVVSPFPSIFLAVHAHGILGPFEHKSLVLPLSMGAQIEPQPSLLRR